MNKNIVRFAIWFLDNEIILPIKQNLPCTLRIEKCNKTCLKNKKGPKNIYLKINYKVELFATSMSISMLLMSFLVFFKVLKPRKHTSDDLSREKQILALIHAIVV